MLRGPISLVLLLVASRAALAAPALIPRPLHVEARACGSGLSLARPLRFAPPVDPGGFEIVRERWTALGIPAPVVSDGVSADVAVAALARAAEGAYTLDAGRAGVR